MASPRLDLPAAGTDRMPQMCLVGGVGAVSALRRTGSLRSLAITGHSQSPARCSWTNFQPNMNTGRPKRRKLQALQQQADPILQDHPELTGELTVTLLEAEQTFQEATTAAVDVAVGAAASAGIQEADQLQQKRAHARAERARRKASCKDAWLEHSSKVLLIWTRLSFVGLSQLCELQYQVNAIMEQMTYKVSAIAASCGVCTAAVAAVYLRFSWHMQSSGDHEFPTTEALATLLLTLGGVVGMEAWARYAHKALWHDFKPGWSLHKSHHEPRLGPFEANDIYAIINAVPAISLCLYGFLTPSLAGGVCFGAGLGITLFGIMYMFIHDGLVHKRFPVGPIAEVPYLQRVAAAHKLHHAERYNGVPWGMFLGPQELEAVGAKDDLDALCKSMFPRKFK